MPEFAVCGERGNQTAELRSAEHGGGSVTEDRLAEIGSAVGIDLNHWGQDGRRVAAKKLLGQHCAMELSAILPSIGIILAVLAVVGAIIRRFKPSPSSYRPIRQRARHPKISSLDWVMSRDDWVVVDVETTGISEHSEIVEIAIVGPSGAVLLNQRVLPKGRIPSGAAQVHGITRQALKDCPSWIDIDATVRRHLAGKRVIA
jgi:Exonuclease